MAFLLVVLAVLVTAPAGGGPSGADRAEIEALMVEIRDSHAATVAAHDSLAARAAERSAAHVAAVEARAARGEPLFLDVDTLTSNAAASARGVGDADRAGENTSGQHPDTARGRDRGGDVGSALPLRDGRGPDATGHRGVGPRCGAGGTGPDASRSVAGRVSGAGPYESHRELANLRQ